MYHLTSKIYPVPTQTWRAKFGSFSARRVDTQSTERDIFGMLACLRFTMFAVLGLLGATICAAQSLQPPTCGSQCMSEIVRGDVLEPDQFLNIGYFSSWNPSRPCLKMDMSQFPYDRYSHIHFAFAEIKRGTYEIDVSKVQSQFTKFVRFQGAKRILVIGGWTFSTSASTYDIFRAAVNSTNRFIFATRVASFVTKNDLDGVDFDWEYPSATGNRSPLSSASKLSFQISGASHQVSPLKQKTSSNFSPS